MTILIKCKNISLIIKKKRIIFQFKKKYIFQLEKFEIKKKSKIKLCKSRIIFY